MTTLVDLNRRAYMLTGGTKKRPSLNYLSAKYKNIKFLLPTNNRFVITVDDSANSFGIAFREYGDRGYWWIVCLYNGIIDPVTDIAPGTVIQLPSLADVNALLSSQEENTGTNNVITI